MRNFFNPGRIYSLNDEAALVMCDWPKDKPKPAVPIPYAEETMNGFEYAAASQMIQSGLFDEGLEVVKEPYSKKQASVFFSLYLSYKGEPKCNFTLSMFISRMSFLGFISRRNDPKLYYY